MFVSIDAQGFQAAMPEHGIECRNQIRQDLSVGARKRGDLSKHRERAERNRRITAYVLKLLAKYSWLECGEVVLALVERIGEEK